MSSAGYISRVLCAPQAAARLLDSYDAALRSLQADPTFYPLGRTATERYGRNIYRKSVENYFLYYFVDEEASEVVVFSFLHKRQDTTVRLSSDYEQV